jgi:hypothetical protein
MRARRSFIRVRSVSTGSIPTIEGVERVEVGLRFDGRGSDGDQGPLLCGD